jgi:antitoxin FitA
MARITIRKLEDTVVQRLKERAARHGSSMEEEVRRILRNAVKSAPAQHTRLGSRSTARFTKVALEDDLPELPGQPVRS